MINSIAINSILNRFLSVNEVKIFFFGSLKFFILFSEFGITERATKPTIKFK